MKDERPLYTLSGGEDNPVVAYCNTLPPKTAALLEEIFDGALALPKDNQAEKENDAFSCVSQAIAFQVLQLAKMLASRKGHPEAVYKILPSILEDLIFRLHYMEKEDTNVAPN